MDKLVIEVVDIRQDMKQFATKQELRTLSEQMAAGFDEMAKRFNHLDQERIAAYARFERIEAPIGLA